MLRLIKEVFGKQRNRRAAGNRRNRVTRFGIEPLESRNLLASLIWTGGGDGTLWSSPANWTVEGTNTHQVPGSDDDVLIGDFATVTSTSTVTIRSLQVQAGARLDNLGGMTVENGLTNYGTISLGSRWGADLHVTSGTLLNAAGGEIICLHWTGDWTYSVDMVGDIDNQGTIQAERSFFNINLSGPDDARQASDHSFVNTGTIELTGGPWLAIAGLASPEDLGDFEGDGLLGIHFATWNLSSDWVIPAADSVVIGLMECNVTVQGSLTNSVDNWLILFDSTIRGDVVNSGHLSAVGDPMIDGELTLPSSSTLTVGFGETPSFISEPPPDLKSELTVTQGFTNHGRIELFNTISDGTLNVVNGTLVNASDGTITSSLGVFVGGQGNFLHAQLDNQGMLRVSDANLTISNGFTNRGTIDLSSTSTNWKELTVTDGTLVNAPGATIRFQGNGPDLGADIAAEVNNQGTISVTGGQLSVNPDWATNFNPAWTFRNSGAIHTGEAAVFSLGGKFSPNQGTIDGGGALAFEGASVTLYGDWSPVIPVFVIRGSLITGPGTLIIPAGNGVGLYNATIDAAIENRGHLGAGGRTKVSVHSATPPVIGGPLTMASGSVLLVGYDPDAWASTSHAWVDEFFVSSMQSDGDEPADVILTIASGFVNHGQIVLSKVDGGNTINVTNGTLVNASDGTITSSVAVASGSGVNRLNARLENQGVLSVSNADLAINQQSAGSLFSLNNTAGGTIDVAAGRTLTVGGMDVVNQGAIRLDGNAVVDFAVASVAINGQGSLQGDAAGTVHIRGSLLGNTQNVAAHSPPGTVWLDGSGTEASPQRLEVMQVDQGDVAAGYADNLAYHNLKLGPDTYVQLVDQARNSLSTAAEAAYVESLTVPAGSTLDRNKLRFYAHQTTPDMVQVNLPAVCRNYANPLDVDGNGVITPRDVLIVINYINSHPGSTAAPTTATVPPLYYDVTDGPNGDGDGQITARDVLILINYINSKPAASAEGESAAQPRAIIATDSACQDDLLAVIADHVASSRQA